MSKKTKETVITVLVLVIIAAFATFYIIYPLIAVPKLTSRPDREKFDDPEYVPENNPEYFVDMGFAPDTFSVTTDDNLKLASLYFAPDSSVFDSIRGTVIILNSSDTDRTAYSDYLRPLLDSGLAVVLYDQRATGLTGGQQHTPGMYEADDLNQVLIYLKFHEIDAHPMIITGFEIGADAAINASRKEKREEMVIAVDPYLTATRWIAGMKEKKGAWSIPLYKGVYYWWYVKLYGIALARTDVDDIQPAASQTILYVPDKDLNSEEVTRLVEISGDNVHPVKMPPDPAALMNSIIERIYGEI